MSTSRQRWLFLLKLLVSVFVFYLIARTVHWHDVRDSLLSVNVGILFVVLLIFFLCVILSAQKWWYLLKFHRAPFPFASLVRWYFVGMFFNNFLPTSIGGDAYRIYRTYRNSRSRATSIIAVLLERVTGLLTLLAMGWFAAIYYVVTQQHPLARVLFYIGVIGIGGSLIVALCLFLIVKLGLLSSVKAPAMFKPFVEHGLDYRHDWTGGVMVMLLSLVFQSVSVGWVWLLARAVGADLSLGEVMIIWSMVTVVTLLPVSINGLGVVEGSFIYLSGQFGVEAAPALTLVLLSRVLVLPISLVGMVLYIVDRQVSVKDVTDAELKVV